LGPLVAVHQLRAQAKPPAFLVFETEIKDRDAYEPHRQTSQRELQKAGAKYLTLGASPVVLEGEAPKKGLPLANGQTSMRSKLGTPHLK